MERVAYDNSGCAMELGHHCYRPDMYGFDPTLVAKQPPSPMRHVMPPALAPTTNSGADSQAERKRSASKR